MIVKLQSQTMRNIVAGLLGMTLLAVPAAAEPPSPRLPPARIAPSTISPEFARIWQQFFGKPAPDTPSPAASDKAAWRRLQDANEARMAGMLSGIAQVYGVTTLDKVITGVPVVEVTPHGWRDDGRLLVYVHGGGFTALSAHSTLFSSGLMAHATGLKIVSIDYTLAPGAQWRTVLAQVEGVYRALLAGGARPGGIGVFGDSAGGSIVAGAVLKLRDDGVPLPGAVVLLSPWSDVSMIGDTYQTLADWDPALNGAELKISAAAYADPADQKNPYVSPVYGDYAKGYPPTLIQGGTREIFLSNFVRQYRAIADAGGVAQLDLYEGMPHVFQSYGLGTPEGQAAMKTVAAFWNRYLVPGPARK